MLIWRNIEYSAALIKVKMPDKNCSRLLLSSSIRSMGKYTVTCLSFCDNIFYGAITIYIHIEEIKCNG